MRKDLAERLLAKILEWDTDVISKERPLLQAMSSFKFDEYQQYSIGTLFIESLVKWLNQFNLPVERQIAYDFIKERLIFISSNQVLHLVNITYDTLIKPILITKTAHKLNHPPYDLKFIVKSLEYVNMKRQSLFIGLSDGAKIDQLRRSSGLNNEQVVPTYEISRSKIKDLLKELAEENGVSKFETIFLIDDFTASGTSYYRKIDGEIKGKIPKIISKIVNPKSDIYSLINQEQTIDIKIIFYIATTEAIENIKKYLSEDVFSSPEYQNIKISIHVIQEINSDIKDKILRSNVEFIELSKKYITDKIVDQHWAKAKHKHYYLGYNECCLPIVLSHNTPNNSLPLLWWSSSENNFHGLFPRITRHS